MRYLLILFVLGMSSIVAAQPAWVISEAMGPSGPQELHDLYRACVGSKCGDVAHSQLSYDVKSAIPLGAGDAVRSLNGSYFKIVYFANGEVSSTKPAKGEYVEARIAVDGNKGGMNHLATGPESGAKLQLFPSSPSMTIKQAQAAMGEKVGITVTSEGSKGETVLSDVGNNTVSAVRVPGSHAP